MKVTLRSRHWRLERVIVLLLALIPLLAASQPCHVTVTTDAPTGPGSLKAALQQVAMIDGACRIDFGDRDGLFSAPRTIQLDGPLPVIHGEVTIDGFIERLLWRAYGATISGGGQHRLLEIAPGGSLTLRGVTLREGFGDNGGAIVNHGRLVVDSTSLFDNEAVDTGGAIFSTGATIVVNSTLIGNRARLGGAVANMDGTLRVVHATFHDNVAGKGGALLAFGELSLANSILSGTGNQCHNAGDLGEMIHNLIHGDHVACGEPLLTVDPRFERLDYYNGPTMTLSLSGTSPAINLAASEAAVDAHGERLTWDQRGNGDPRFAGGFADLGAFERQGPLPEAIEVNARNDNGLRVCTGQGLNNCPLRAAIELAVAGRHLVPIRFNQRVFDQPARLILDDVSEFADVPLVLDGEDRVRLEIEVPGIVAWVARSGVELIMPEAHTSVEDCDG